LDYIVDPLESTYSQGDAEAMEIISSTVDPEERKRKLDNYIRSGKSDIPDHPNTSPTKTNATQPQALAKGVAL
jgi:hypothetical protein